MSNDINIRNKRASFDYEFIEEYNAGMILKIGRASCRERV